MNAYNCAIVWTPTTDVIYRRWLMMRLKKSHDQSLQEKSIFRNVQLKQLIQKSYRKKPLTKNSSTDYISISAKPYSQIYHTRTSSTMYKKDNTLNATFKPTTEYYPSMHSKKSYVNHQKRLTLPAESLTQHIRDESIKKVSLFLKPCRYKTMTSALGIPGNGSFNEGILRSRKVGVLNKLGFT